MVGTDLAAVELDVHHSILTHSNAPGNLLVKYTHELSMSDRHEPSVADGEVVGFILSNHLVIKFSFPLLKKGIFRLDLTHAQLRTKSNWLRAQNFLPVF